MYNLFQRLHQSLVTSHLSLHRVCKTDKPSKYLIKKPDRRAVNSSQSFSVKTLFIFSPISESNCKLNLRITICINIIKTRLYFYLVCYNLFVVFFRYAVHLFFTDVSNLLIITIRSPVLICYNEVEHFQIPLPQLLVWCVFLYPGTCLNSINAMFILFLEYLFRHCTLLRCYHFY